MEYCNLKFEIKLSKDLYFKEVNETLSRFINKTMFFDRELSDLHIERAYKYYCFSGLLPLEKDKVYKKDKSYVFTLRTLNKDFAKKIQELSKKIYIDAFEVLSCKLENRKVKYISEIRTITPVIITVDDGPWKIDNDLLLLIKRLHANLEKKYKRYYNEEIESEQNFINKIKILNRKPIALKYKNISLIGNKFEVVPNSDDISQKLAFMAVATGLGEKSSSLGAGFCMWR